MNVLLIYLAIAFVVIVISIALQKLLKSPILVATIVFSVILLIGIILNNTTLILTSIFFGILSYVAIMIQCIISRLLTNNMCNNINLIQNNQADTSNINELNNNFCGNSCRFCRRR